MAELHDALYLFIALAMVISLVLAAVDQLARRLPFNPAWVAAAVVVLGVAVATVLQ